MKEKKTRYEMRFAGSGGQGVILCSIILAEAAFLAGKRVAQSQSYGPEARGGLCRAELVVDENEITYPKVMQPDFLLTLTQASLDKFGANTSEDALIMIDKSLLEPDDLGSYNVVSLPILQTAARATVPHRTRRSAALRMPMRRSTLTGTAPSSSAASIRRPRILPSAAITAAR